MLPQLIEEDVARLQEELRALLEQTDATTALLADLGGFLIASEGEVAQFNVTTLGALAAGSFMASQTIAGLVHETRFDSVYQQGEQASLLVVAVGQTCLLVVIFGNAVTVGVVKYFALPAVERIAGHLQRAWERSPNNTLDLSQLNLADTGDLFKKSA